MGKDTRPGTRNNCGNNEQEIEIYRRDDLYHLTLRQHAALAFAFCAALDRIGKADDRDTQREDITQKDAFRKRYNDLFTASSLNECCIASFVETLRNYFSHYLHSSEPILALKDHFEFQKFIQLLRQKAKNVWREHHRPQLELYSLPKEKEADAKELFAQVIEFDWDVFQECLNKSGRENLEGTNCPVPFCDILLLLSMFISKGDMTRLLDALPGLKINGQKDKSGQPLPPSVELRAKREVLTALCLDESHDLRSDGGDVITALTILDHFAQRMGARKDREGKPIHSAPRRMEVEKFPSKEDPEPQPLPDICRSQSDIFFIKMLVATIEACGFLPCTCIARARDGEPVFADCAPITNKRRQIGNTGSQLTRKNIITWYKNAELYIKGSNVAIAIKQDNGDLLTGSLGINALKLIAIKGMQIRKEIVDEDKRTEQYSSNIVSPIRECLEKLSYSKTAKLYFKKKDWIPSMLPAIFSMEKLPDANPDIAQAIASRIDYLKQRAKRICRDHHKAIFILWWINCLLKEKKPLNKAQYSELIIILTSNFDYNCFKNELSKIDTKILLQKEGHKILQNALSARSLEMLFYKIKKNFEWYIGKTGPAQSSDPEILRTAAKTLGVRCVKKPLDEHTLDKARESFCNRFGAQLSPSPRYLFMKYFQDLRCPAESRDTKDTGQPNPAASKKHPDHNRLPVFAVINSLRKKDTEFRPDKNLYYYHRKDGKARLVEKARICLEHDCLLLFLAEQLLNDYLLRGDVTLKENFTYEARIPVTVDDNKELTLVIDSAQARRSYVSLHPTRICNVLKNYWVPFNPDKTEIPFVCKPPENPESNVPPCEPRENPDKTPRSWLEAEGLMERERRILLQAVFCLEKELVGEEDIEAAVKRLGNGEAYVKFKKLLKDKKWPGAACERLRVEMTNFRNKALHQAATEQRFSEAPGRLGKLFKEIEEKMRKDAERKRQKCTRENSKNAKKTEKIERELTKFR